jgi:long-subunit acyl-CoA synthetase (AMP-forming)
LWDRAARVAGGLSASGVARGDRVALRLGNGFGLTETSSVTTYLPHEYAAEHADLVGFPVPVCDVRVGAFGDEDIGELLVRGPNVVAGYWNKPDASAATFAGGKLLKRQVRDETE